MGDGRDFGVQAELAAASPNAAALNRSNADLDQFASAASHDLKAPLRNIAALTEWLAEDLGDRLTDVSRGYLDTL